MIVSKYIDRICFGIIVFAVLLTFVFASGEQLGIQSIPRNMGYENRLFDDSRVHTVDIVMDDWDSFIETCENEEYVLADVVIDGEAYSNVGIRAKGNTSLSTVSQMGSERYSFKIEFDHYDSGKSYYGLDKMSLNNLIQDTTLMKDYLAYQMMDDFGADAPLSSYVYITVNGEDWGLYLAVEAIEDAFLQRNYGSDYGELYKPDSMSFGGGRGNGKNFDVEDLDMGDFNMEDFDFSNLPQGNWNGDRTSQREQGTTSDRSQTPSRGDSEVEPSDESSSTQRPSNFDFGNMGGMFGMGSSDVKLQYIDESYSSYSNIFNNAKTGITNADKDRLIDSLEKLSNQEDLENIVDIEEVIRYFVVHNFVVNGDSYTGSMIHNYYLYEEDGMLSMIPWDYNLAFGTFQGGMGSSAVNEDIDFELSDRPMVNWIFTNEEYTQMYYEYYAEFLEMFFANDELVNKINDTIEMITPYVEKDPTKFITMEEFEKGVETMKSFVELRSQSVALQLSGSDESVDASSISVSDMGGMNMGGKGGMSFDRPEGMENFPSFNGNPTENTENNTTPQTKPNTTGSNRAPSSQGTSQNVPTDMSNILYLAGIFATLLFSILVVSKVKRRGF